METEVLEGKTPALEGTKADNLANVGRINSDESDERRQIHNVRDKILSASIRLIEGINKKVEVLNKLETNGPSDVTDDFSACATADQERIQLL